MSVKDLMQMTAESHGEDILDDDAKGASAEATSQSEAAHNGASGSGQTARSSSSGDESTSRQQVREGQAANGQAEDGGSRKEHTLSDGDRDPETKLNLPGDADAKASSDPGGDGEPGAEGADTGDEADATSGGQDDAGDGDLVQYTTRDEVPDEHKDYKYVGTDSVYPDDEAILQGIEEKDKHIKRQKDQIAALEKQRTDREKALEARLALYEDRMPSDELRGAMAQEHMPDEFRDKTKADYDKALREVKESSLSDEERQARLEEIEAEKEKFIIAQHNAEEKAKEEIDNRLNADERADEEFAERLKKAQPKIDEVFNSKFFGVDTAEDEVLLAETLQEMTPESGTDPIELAQHIQADLLGVHDGFAEFIARAVRDRFNEKRRTRGGQIRRVERNVERTRNTGRSDDVEPPRQKRNYNEMSGRELTQSAKEELMKDMNSRL